VRVYHMAGIASFVGLWREAFIRKQEIVPERGNYSPNLLFTLAAKCCGKSIRFAIAITKS
jgi:hypothetical protein